MFRITKLKFTFSIIIILVYIVAIPLMNFNHHNYNNNEGVITWDIKSYYAYLPAAIIYNDLSLSYIDKDPGKFNKWIWPITTPTGNKAILTTMGLSVMYSPFFFLAHGIALNSEKYEADGYSFPYHVALTFSVYFYFILALIILRKVLRKFFSEFSVGLTLLAVAAGTNLLEFLTYSAPMSHGYSFFLIVLFIYFLIRWKDKSSIKNSIFLGLTAGLISLIRPTNTLVILLIPLYSIYSLKTIGENLKLLLMQWPKLLIIATCMFLVWFPQMLYWHKVAGKFFYFSYGEVGGSFFFNNPQIFNILFSYRKGWFVYTPIMLIATLGIYYLNKQKVPLAYGITIYFIINLYILSSWWSWWFGGGFGNRAFVDSYGLMAFPLAALIDHFRKAKVTIWIVSGLIIILSAFNNFQIQQYRSGAIHWVAMNKEAYWEGFLKLKPTCKYWNILRQPDIENARKGIYVTLPFYDHNISRDDLYVFVENEISSGNAIKARLDSVAQISGRPFEELKAEYVNSYINNGMASEEYRILRVNFLKNLMKDCSYWQKEIERKAQRKKISKEEMIDTEANRIFETYSQKYIIQ